MNIKSGRGTSLVAHIQLEISDYQGGNLVYKHNTIKFDTVRESISNYTEQTKKHGKIDLPLIAARIFYSFPNGIARTI